jgi:carboxyl-terminal processing protease
MKGIDPDIVVAEDLPPELVKSSSATTPNAAPKTRRSGNSVTAKAEAGSPAYIPPDPGDDKQLNYALDLVRRVLVNAAFPADPSKGVPN